MPRKPQLKALKGWRYRIILCDSEGNYEFDDYNFLPALQGALTLLNQDLEKKKARKEVASL